MSDFVVRRPPRPAEPTPEELRRRKVGLLTGAIALGLGALLTGWMYLGIQWDLSRIYGNETPWASAPYALVPALLLAGCIRCVLSLRHRDKPGLLLLLAVTFAVMAATGVVLGVVGNAQNEAYRAAQTDTSTIQQRDTLRGLPMNQGPDGSAVGEPMCGADGLCGIDVWVKGGTTAESLAAMTAQMEAAGWTTLESGPSGATYAGPLYVVQATVTQEGDKGGTDVLVSVIK